MIDISDKMFKTAVNEVAATEAGKIVIAALMLRCKWNSCIVSSESPQVTQFHAAQRGVYGSFRSEISNEHLKHIEFNYRSKPHDDGIRSTKRISKRTDNPSDKRSNTSK